MLLLLALLSADAGLLAQDYNLTLRSTMDFPGQTLANVWGYWQNGREYALVGGAEGLIIVDITNPDQPQQLIQIGGPDNLWKEIKTYGHYAYVTSEGGQGLQIVDLSALPNITPAAASFYTGDGAIEGQLNRIHALHIDTTRGFLYAYGGELFGGGAKVFDLKPDPANPVYVGKFDQLGYIHDGYAENDTLYACHISAGIMSVVDMSDKANPQVLGTVETPGRFTHNSWLLSDRKHILTTDEDFPSFVAAYDISDPSDIQELDRIATDKTGANSIGHNTHVLNDWAVTSWYIDGVTIVDAHRPQNLVQVGRYDTYELGGKFDGCWGVFPFFPSGNMVATNIPFIPGDPATPVAGRLFVLTPTYVRACYLEGNITNACNGQPLSGVEVVINSGDPLASTESRNNGDYKTGQPQPGTYTVTLSKEGFLTQNISVTLASGQVSTLNVNMQPESAYNIVGTVLDAVSEQPIPNATVQLASDLQDYTLQTDGNGQFSISCAPGATYQIKANSWGYLPANFALSDNGAALISLQRGYYDDFGFNLGWTTAAQANNGQWVLAQPIGTSFGGQTINPDSDLPNDGNERCYVTGNAGGGAGNADVDDGYVILSSPAMQLSDYQDAKLSFHYWFVNTSGLSAPNDRLQVVVTNGVEADTLFSETASLSDWRFRDNIFLGDYVSMTDNVQVKFIAFDDQPGHLVEAAVDAFQVQPLGFVSVPETPRSQPLLQAAPNPSARAFALRYDNLTLPGALLQVRNALGQLVFEQALDAASGQLQCGENWPAGLYFASLWEGGRQCLSLKMVKQ
jgi:choice-of-anchor B domain-containing protein